MSRLNLFAIAAPVVQTICACGGSAVAPTSAVAPASTVLNTAAPTSSASLSKSADHLEARRFVTALVQGTSDSDGPLLIGLGLWRGLCATDAALGNIGARVATMIPGPDGSPQLDSHGDPKTVEVSHIVSEDSRFALARSSATRRFARRLTEGKFREATPAERRLVMDRTPSNVPVDVPIDVVEAPPSIVAFVLLDGHVFWMDDLSTY